MKIPVKLMCRDCVGSGRASLLEPALHCESCGGSGLNADAKARRYETAIRTALRLLEAGAAQRADALTAPIETDEELWHYEALLNAPEQAADFAVACLGRALEGVE